MIRFSHRVWYRDKDKMEQLVCVDCGAKPLYEWNESSVSMLYYYGVVEMTAQNVRCQNGPHEIDDATLEQIKAQAQRGKTLEEHSRKGWFTRKVEDNG